MHQASLKFHVFPKDTPELELVKRFNEVSHSGHPPTADIQV
jgi:hypothetical protein